MLIWTKYGPVMALDSRTNTGRDQVNVARCTIEPVEPGATEPADAELQPQATPPSS